MRTLKPTVTELFAPEEFIAKRLLDHGIAVFDGDTNIDSRREATRAAILKLGLAAVIIGRKDGKPEDYASCFARVYGQSLKPHK